MAIRSTAVLSVIAVCLAFVGFGLLRFHRDRRVAERTEQGITSSNRTATEVAHGVAESGGSLQLSPRNTGGCAAADIHVALISYGWTAAGYYDASSIKGPGTSLRVAVKGLLRSASDASRVHLHFVVGPTDQTETEALMDSLAAALSSRRCAVQWDFTPLNETQVDEWMRAIGHTASHRTGYAGNVKFFYPLLFPRIDKLLMLDSDVLIAADVGRLWQHFARIERHAQQLFAFAPQWPVYDRLKDNQFNAGVGLLRLDRMREAAWITLARDAITRWTQQSQRPPCCAHGDQSVFHMIRWLRPETMPPTAMLPRAWNLNKCHRYQGLATPAQQRAALHASTTADANSTLRVGLVHLGCCKMCTVAKIGPVWGALFHDIDRWPPVDATTRGQ